LWNRFIALAGHIKKNKTSIAFFSATPQGASAPNHTETLLMG
jgi:hypothetical protein